MSSKYGKNYDIVEFKFKFFYQNLYIKISLLNLKTTLLTYYAYK